MDAVQVRYRWRRIQYHRPLEAGLQRLHRSRRTPLKSLRRPFRIMLRFQGPLCARFRPPVLPKGPREIDLPHPVVQVNRRSHLADLRKNLELDSLAVVEGSQELRHSAYWFLVTF